MQELEGILAGIAQRAQRQLWQLPLQVSKPQTPILTAVEE